MLCSVEAFDEAAMRPFSALTPQQTAELFEQANTIAVRLKLAADNHSEKETPRSESSSANAVTKLPDQPVFDKEGANENVLEGLAISRSESPVTDMEMKENVIPAVEKQPSLLTRPSMLIRPTSLGLKPPTGHMAANTMAVS